MYHQRPGPAVLIAVLRALRRWGNTVGALDLPDFPTFGGGVVVGALADAALLHVLAKVLGGSPRAAPSRFAVFCSRVAECDSGGFLGKEAVAIPVSLLGQFEEGL